jgi:hypothetical protein
MILTFYQLSNNLLNLTVFQILNFLFQLFYFNGFSISFLIHIFLFSNDFLNFKFPSQLFDVVYREETLLNVIRSVTRNGRSIILTAVLAIILVYMFSIIGYIFFKDDFLVTIDDDLIGEFNFVVQKGSHH